MKKIYFVYALLCGLAISSCNSNADNNPDPVDNTIDSVKTGLVAYYPFNSSAVDATGRGNDGTVHGAVLTTNRFNKDNSAYNFDGTSNYIEVKENAYLRLNGTDFTINAWVQLDEYNSTYGSVILSKRGNTALSGWILGVSGSSSAPGDVNVGRAFFQVSQNSDPLSLSIMGVKAKQWHMLTVVYDNEKKLAGFYIDGVFDSQTASFPNPADVTSVLLIGADSQNLVGGIPTQHFTKGKIDDIRIYNRVITAAEVTSLYSLNF